MNKKMVKILSITMAAAVLATGCTAKNTDEETKPIEENVEIEENTDEEIEIKEQEAKVINLDGTIKEVFNDDSDTLSLMTEVNGEETVFNFNKEDLKLIGYESIDEIKEGDNFITYVDANSPQTLQLPVTYRTDLIVKDDETELLQDLDYFNEDLVNSKNDLQITGTEDTEIISLKEDGSEELIDSLLLVKYDISTRSIPAQTNPKTIYIIK